MKDLMLWLSRYSPYISMGVNILVIITSFYAGRYWNGVYWMGAAMINLALIYGMK